jgi:hypothetical protein
MTPLGQVVQPASTTPTPTTPTTLPSVPAGQAALPEHIISSPTVLVAASGGGGLNKYYYRFENVRLTRSGLTVYLPPGVDPPPEEHWVDFISSNTTSPRPPTMIVIKGDLHTTKWYYLPVKYVRADELQPRCKAWVEKPSYLLQVRYSYNIWHTWNEGLMGFFQSLREQGALPLVQVDEEGNMRWAARCHWKSWCSEGLLCFNPCTWSSLSLHRILIPCLYLHASPSWPKKR